MKIPGEAEVRKRLPPASAELVDAVLRVADERELCVYLVGGPVRDLLLGRDVRDVDLIVEAVGGRDADALAREAAPPGSRLTSHPRFATVTLRAGEGEVDLATARRESYAHDGALPTVELGTLEEDLHRRDFGVNALALPVSRSARARHPRIADPGQGLSDLREGRLRVLHDRSFHDDPTRALRACRLGPRLGFALARSSRSALRSALRDGAFGRVSGDRLRRELVKLFDDAELGLDPSRALRLLSEWHVLAALEPGLLLEPGAALPLRRLGRARQSPIWRTPRWRPWVAGLALWLAPLKPGLRGRALRRFAVRGEAARRIAAFPRARDSCLRALGRARGRGAVDAALAALDEEELQAVFACSAPTLRRRIARYAAEDRVRRPPVNGHDLVEAGLSGAAVGRALGRIRVAWLDGAVKSREDALVLARELGRRRSAR